MKIAGLFWLHDVVNKLTVKHQVEIYEVEEIFTNRPKIRFMEKGERPGEDVYIGLGKTDAGRYLAVLFIYKINRQALILSARNMANKERKSYARK
ncbi:MAG: BrnT family toxin [Chloroflexi bacterium]|nr:BrnT family toxin [Chloroflexota bacterium]MBU1661940.1 BrnT family toxin [Chloroflexota bacterium]